MGIKTFNTHDRVLAIHQKKKMLANRNTECRLSDRRVRGRERAKEKRANGNTDNSNNFCEIYFTYRICDDRKNLCDKNKKRCH